MTSVDSLIAALQRLDAANLSAEDKAVVDALLNELAPIADMELSKLFSLFRPKPKRTSKAKRTGGVDRAPPQSVHDIAERLRVAFDSDSRFDDELDALASDRSVTKPVLIDLHQNLFERPKGFPAKTTRAQIIRSISDERLIRVRNTKTGAMLGRKPAPAD